jgi:acyl-CoA thioester hydrolase
VPKENMFSYTFEVSADDIDELGHASNIAVIRWIQEAAVGHSTLVGLDMATYQKLGCVFVVRRQEVDYLRSALRGETLQVRTWIDTVSAAQTIRLTEFTRASDGELLVSSRTNWAYVHVARARPTRIPDEIRKLFGHAPMRAATS